MQGLRNEESSKKMLDRGIDLKYTYTLTGSDETWNFDFTKGYCP